MEVANQTVRDVNLQGSQSKSNDQKSKDATMRISRVVESPSTLSEGSHSRPSGYVTQVDITQKGHVRAKGSAPKGNGPDRNKGIDAISKGYRTEFIHYSIGILNLKV
jgi:hypothetical protein